MYVLCQKNGKAHNPLRTQQKEENIKKKANFYKGFGIARGGRVLFELVVPFNLFIHL